MSSDAISQHDPVAIVDFLVANAPQGFVAYFPLQAGDAPLFDLSAAVDAVADARGVRIAVAMATLDQRRKLSIYRVG